MANPNVVFDIGSGAPLPELEYNPEAPAQYVKNLTEKPRVSAPAIGSATLPRMRHLFMQRFNITPNPSITSEEARLYLRLFMANMTEVLDERWTPLGITIGNQGETISPNSLLTYADINAPEMTVPDDTCDITEYGIVLIGALIYPYRVKNNNLPIHAAYKTALAQKLSIPLSLNTMATRPI